MLFLYRLLTALLYPFYRYGFLPYRLKINKEDPERYTEKLGFPSLDKDTKKLVWSHAASVGESLSLLKLIGRFVRENPTWKVLITTGTVTSAKIVKERFPKQVIHQYAPLDCVCALNRFLDHWQPDLMVWVESELWPNLIHKASLQKIPLILLNMRLSPRSFTKWATFKKTFLKLLNCFDLILTQTQELNKDLKGIGYKKSHFCGNLKYAADPPGFQKEELNILQKSLGNRPHWMVASTHNLEEDIVLQAHKKLLKIQKNTCLILVVRHPHRCSAVEHLIKNQGLSYQRYSHWQETSLSLKEDILLVDQMGFMGLFYEISSYVLVAGSLVDHIGGHNILEPLRQNCVTLHGPYMSNFKEVVADAKKAKATLEIQDADDLADTLLEFMNTPQKTETYLKNGHTFLTQQTQVLDHISDYFSPYLQQEVPRERA